jgi:hypothetical protein
MLFFTNGEGKDSKKLKNAAQDPKKGFKLQFFVKCIVVLRQQQRAIAARDSYNFLMP